MDTFNEMRKNDDEESVLAEEIAALESIYIRELEVTRTDRGQVECVRLLLNPATAENPDEQFVCLILELSPPPQYPDELPGIAFRNPRGLAEEHVNSLRQELQSLAEERRGGHMLYDLIELAKESLTVSNIPDGPCAVCLEPFSAAAALSKTQCYHYFHALCLHRHVTIAEAQIESDRQTRRRERGNVPDKVDEQVCCPVCRKPIEYDLAALSASAAHSAAPEDFHYQPDAAMRALQHRMATMFQAQKAKGGIIDPEEEQKKLMLSHAQQIIEASAEEAAATESAADNPARPDSAKARGKGKSNRDRRGKEDYVDPRYEPRMKGPGDRGNLDGETQRPKDRDRDYNKRQSGQSGQSQNARQRDRYLPKENHNGTREVVSNRDGYQAPLVNDDKGQGNEIQGSQDVRIKDKLQSRQENYGAKYERKRNEDRRENYDRKPRNDNGRRENYDRKPRNEDTRRETYDRKPRNEDTRRETYDRKPRNEDSRRETYDRKPRNEDTRRETYDRKPRNEDTRRETYDRKPRNEDTRRETYDRKPRNDEPRRENSDRNSDWKPRSETVLTGQDTPEPNHLEASQSDNSASSARGQRENGRRGRGHYKGQNRDRYQPPASNGLTPNSESSQGDATNAQFPHEMSTSDGSFSEDKVKDANYYGPRRGRGRARGHAGKSSASFRPPPGLDSTKPRPPPGFEACS